MVPLPDPRELPAEAAVRVLGHLLAGQPWLRERLVAHAGRICTFEVFPVRLTLRIQADGTFAVERDGGTADARIRLSPFVLARLLAGDDRARSEVRLTGDSALASVLTGVLQALRWDAEEDLSRVVGDIAAHRLVQGARQFDAWRAGAIDGAAASVAEYLVEERDLLARKDDLAQWAQEVDALRDAVERLEKRILAVAARRD